MHYSIAVHCTTTPTCLANNTGCISELKKESIQGVIQYSKACCVHEESKLFAHLVLLLTHQKVTDVVDTSEGHRQASVCRTFVPARMFLACMPGPFS